MALKKDKQQYKIKVPNGHIPHVPAKSYVSIAFDALKPTFQRLENEADQTAQANYFQDFQIKTRDAFDQFRKDFPNDPEGMKAAVDTYAKTLLEQVPPAYKIQANAMLGAYSQNSILFASSNKKKFDNQKLLADNEQLWKNQNTEIEFGMSNFSSGVGVNPSLDINGINKMFTNGLDQTNELAHSTYEDLVKNNLLLKESTHIANTENEVEALMVARGYHIMMTHYNTGDDQLALNWLNDYKNGKDAYQFEYKNKDNPIYKMVEGLYNDDDARARIVKAIHTKFKAAHDETILGKKKKIKPDLDMYKEPGNILSLEKFKGGSVDANEIAAQIPNLEIGSPTYDKLVEYVANANRIQSIVSYTMSSDTPYSFENDEDRELWAKAILANQDPPIHEIQYSDLGSESFITAMNLFAKEDYYPDQLRTLLEVTDSGSWKDEGSLNKLKDQALMYQYLSNEELFPHIDYNPLFQKALDHGVITSIINGDYTRASSTLESFQKEDYSKKLENIQIQSVDKTDKFNMYFNAQLKSPNAFLKFFMNEKDEMHKHMFAGQDQTTWVTMLPEKIVPAEAKIAIQGMWHEEMAHMIVGENPDIWSKANTSLRQRAWGRIMNRLKDEGWGIETNTWDGTPKLVKNPYWHEFGTLNNNDVYSAIKADFEETGGYLIHSEKELTDVFNKGYEAQMKIKDFQIFHSPTSLVKMTKEERKAGKEKWTAEMNKWYDKFEEMKSSNEKAKKNSTELMSKYGTAEWENIENNFKKWADNKNGDVKIAVTRNNFKNKTNGKYSYKLTMHEGNEMIVLDKNFEPAGWVDLVNKDVPASNAQIVNHTTNEIYENFVKSEPGVFINDVGLEEGHGERSDWAKRAIHSIIRNGVKLSDYRFYPDIPGINDVPAEIRPFAWLAKMVGFDGDIREIQSDLKIQADIANNNLSYQKKINANRDLNDKEKVIQSILPPHKTVKSDNAMNLSFKQWVLDNYQNEDAYRLSHRTNNWTSISSDDWQGEVPVNYKRDSRHFAVFGHPKDSIRAAAKLFLNHSNLTENINGDKIPTEYGSEPTIEELLTKTKYATDMASYFRALDDHPTLNRDTKIDLLNANQMYELLMFITKHEMGADYYKEHFGQNNMFVKSTIFRGISEAINSYNGELGKL